MVDSFTIIKQTDAKKKDYEVYEKSKKEYEGEVEKYDKEVETEEKREKDVFKSTFEPKTKIGETPKPPS